MGNIGFIGLGIMGKPMASHLIKGGHTLFLNTRRSVPEDLIKAGGFACATPKEVAEKADIIVTMLPDTPDVDKVLFGPKGVSEGLSNGKIVIDMSTISPIATKDFAERIKKLGCDYVDAPVSGGEGGAIAASLTIMVGADEAIFNKAKPVLELLGKKITLFGGNGSGQICKLANNIVVALNIEAAAEGLLFASKAGLDPAKVREALLGGSAASKALEAQGERMITRNFTPGFRIELHQKDLNLALESARKMGVSLPNTAATQELFNSCAAQGGIKNDNSYLVAALEALANHEIGK
jgi:2-hydroxy-3-oxopropionate reductase